MPYRVVRIIWQILSGQYHVKKSRAIWNASNQSQWQYKNCLKKMHVVEWILQVLKPGTYTSIACCYDFFSWAKTLAFFGKLKPTPAMSPASSVYCSLPSESVYSDSPKPSVGSVAKGKVAQFLQYLRRNHGLQLGHILFQRLLDLANYVATVYYRFISELVQTSFTNFSMLRSVLLARNHFIAMVMHSQQPMKLLLHWICTQP